MEKLALMVFGEFILKRISSDGEVTSPDHPVKLYSKFSGPKDHPNGVVLTA
jgi:hypothetical protein